MKLFGPIYDKTMQWSKHRYATLLLSIVSFIEAIFFPIPPDVMLAPMAMSKPHMATRYAIYATVASVLGGMIGYAVGYFAFEWAQGLVASWGYQSHFDKAMGWFEQWGIFIVFLAGFSPIPYKVFTICAGVLQMAFLPFVITAAISRFARFYLVARLCAWGGEKHAEKIRRSIEWIGWATIGVAFVAYFIYQLMR